MEIGDIIFRGALVLAVVMLAGVFAYNVGLGDNVEDERPARIAHDLSTLLCSISTWDHGSRAEVIFDTGTDSLPGDINGEPFYIKVLPGSVFVEFEDSMEIVMEDVSVVPSLPPTGPGSLNTTMTRSVGTSLGGFTVRTPCSLNVQVVDHVEGRSLFIWPVHNYSSENQQVIEDLLELCGNKGQIMPGWSIEVTISAEDTYAEDRLLLFKETGIPEMVEGSTGRPFILPNDLDTFLTQEGPKFYVVKKFADLQDDGTYLVTTGIYTL